MDGFHIVSCTDCGVRFLEPQPSATDLRRIYDAGYFANGDSGCRGYEAYAAEEDNIRRTFRDRLTDLPQRRGRLLDVGAATGFFVDEAAAAGWEASGVEPSAWAASHARERLGVEVITGTLEETAYPTSAFDVVTMWEVIEHLPDPRATLREVHRILRPGGQLVLSTPDAGSVAARISGRHWLGWRKVPEHLYFFDCPNLDRLLVECGFNPVRHRYASLTVSVGFALDRLGALLGMSRIPLPAAIRNRSARVNPFYDLLIVADRA
ncbi:MAG: class I SAM-dependent methyltransferase [Candidatus Limnocylindrales bacterium]